MPRKHPKVSQLNVEMVLTSAVQLSKVFTQLVEGMLQSCKQTTSNTARLGIINEYRKAELAYRSNLENLSTSASKSGVSLGLGLCLGAAATSLSSSSATSSHPPMAVVAQLPPIIALASAPIQQPAAANVVGPAANLSATTAPTIATAQSTNRPPPPPKQATPQDLEDEENRKRVRHCEWRLLELRHRPTVEQARAVNNLLCRIPETITFADAERFTNVDKQVVIFVFDIGYFKSCIIFDDNCYKYCRSSLH